ncbi:MAG: RNA-binding transcriptional accessory protein [Anaerolineales bacterium]|nr:RNA-binding transcriptional accessory protein [Anaerolineales bacterium]
MKYAAHIASQLGVSPERVSAAIELLDAGNTLPFIARYRKEATAGLDEEQLRQVEESLARLRALDERRQTVLKSIEEQGKLTPELLAQILAAESMTALEDLYQPYKPKRRTRASVARERGLEPLARLILEQAQVGQPLAELAGPFLSQAVTTVEQAWAGARDIVAEMISDHPEVRGLTRQKALQWGSLSSEKIAGADDPRHVYELYYQFEFRVDKLKPHQVLAINRGEAEKVLRARVNTPERDWRAAVERQFCPDRRSLLAGQLEQAISDAAERLLLPAIERDVRRDLTEKAEVHAIAVFAENLRALLYQPPQAGRVVMGIDPGFRTGCKLAVVDATGKLLDTATIYPHEPQRRQQEALETLARLVARHGVTLISIGNGTASRETEQLAAELTRNAEALRYLIVNEAGASVYSASPLARAELPGLDVSLRGAVSIARRVQDPLAELVKIDPRSIGVGMYQHDVDQKLLAQALEGVVESVVNNVGVDLNTASVALLTYVAGIGPKLAERIVAHRDQHGAFPSRAALMKVSGLGAKAFEQAAGFLRVRGGDHPLDASAIHPESYAVAQALLEKAGLSLSTPAQERKQALDALLARQPVDELARELGVGALTLQDILEQLARPGRDPRQDLPAPILRSDVLAMEDLAVGMRLKGAVRNVVDFGAFVYIGVKQDGLLHRSQLPRGVDLKPGYVIEVVILKVEVERSRISLGWPG